MEDVVAVDYELLVPTPSSTSAARRERAACYAAGQAVAAFRYRVPLEEVAADMGGGRVILWPIVHPTDDYLWGRIVVCLAGQEAVTALERGEDALSDMDREYVTLPAGDDAHTDVATVWQIIPAVQASHGESWNDLFRRARGEAISLFTVTANRAAVCTVARHLAWREAITGMEAMAIIGGTVVRTPQGQVKTELAPLVDKHLTDTDRLPRSVSPPSRDACRTPEETLQRGVLASQF